MLERVRTIAVRSRGALALARKFSSSWLRECSCPEAGYLALYSSAVHLCGMEFGSACKEPSPFAQVAAIAATLHSGVIAWSAIAPNPRHPDLASPASGGERRIGPERTRCPAMDEAGKVTEQTKLIPTSPIRRLLSIVREGQNRRERQW